MSFFLFCTSTWYNSLDAFSLNLQYSYHLVPIAIKFNQKDSIRIYMNYEAPRSQKERRKKPHDFRWEITKKINQ